MLRKMCKSRKPFRRTTHLQLNYSVEGIGSSGDRDAGSSGRSPHRRRKKFSVPAYCNGLRDEHHGKSIPVGKPEKRPGELRLRFIRIVGIAHCPGQNETASAAFSFASGRFQTPPRGSTHSCSHSRCSRVNKRSKGLPCSWNRTIRTPGRGRGETLPERSA